MLRSASFFSVEMGNKEGKQVVIFVTFLLVAPKRDHSAPVLYCNCVSTLDVAARLVEKPSDLCASSSRYHGNSLKALPVRFPDPGPVWEKK